MIGNSDLLNVRTALLITLSILLVLVIWRRLKRHVVANDMPATLHVELRGHYQAYHPTRSVVELHAPVAVSVQMRILNEHHAEVKQWPTFHLVAGNHALEQELPELSDGVYYLELTSATQRTVRQFRLQQA